jgi:hypothetical protein
MNKVAMRVDVYWIQLAYHDKNPTSGFCECGNKIYVAEKKEFLYEVTEW